MRTMGLDFGDKRIGVAISDAFGWTAQGAEVIERKREGDYLERIRELVRDNEVDAIVVGLPKNMNGTIGPRGEICIAFAEELKQALPVAVHMWDERLTTVAAQRTLLEADVSRRKRKQVVDKMAATILLQNFLDSRQKRGVSDDR
ncbi:Holliday junction resolvase RuvX [Cohnella zeiphila]|uniref:Putative pre-16S rRNA nuclease n=1 Tax=Cohnella zeiphila TaxID=2761120 RepID=A0A7X0SSR4_9BACL|nr:Holliday junction resolvase RuvX [Cohnella zeiphila]MBB6735432.1 Holliday junction resolvase RuvX [Cohnella zeiphila]